MIGNAFFFHTINNIGGVETMFYELVRKYKQYDIVIFYVRADQNQLKRLREYVPVIQFDNQVIECKKAFFNYNLMPFIDYVKAEEYIQIVHANYKLQKLIPTQDPRITRHIAVSEANAEVFREYTGKECEVCANPLTIDPVVPPLFICAAQRMTAEKGFNRIVKLVEALDRTEIKYYFLIFTNEPKYINSKNVAYMQARLDIRPFIAASDIFVAVSDSEGRCYSVGEKLGYGNGKLLITPIPSFYEQGCNDKNSILLEYDCSNMDEVVEQIRKEWKKKKLKKSFPKVIPTDGWNEILVKKDSEYHIKRYRVKATEASKIYSVMDIELGRVPEPGEEWVVDEFRLPKLLKSPWGQIAEVVCTLSE